MRAWLLRLWQRLIEAGMRPLEARTAQRDDRLEQQFDELVTRLATQQAATLIAMRDLAQQTSAHGEMLYRLIDRVALLQSEADQLAQLDARFAHLAVMLTGKSATDVMATLHTRPPRTFTFERRQ